MYARDISKKVKYAKHQHAKQGHFVGSQAPYGYQLSADRPRHLIVDPEAARVVRMIFSLAEEGRGSVAIADELKRQEIVTPSVYKHMKGDSRFSGYPPIKKGKLYDWSHDTISQMLNNTVYIGRLTSLKTEVINCKTKQREIVPQDKRIVTDGAHEAIISESQFYRVQEIRATHVCMANRRRFNLFRGKLFCDCCGGSLAIATKSLLDGDKDMYFCQKHYRDPESCPKTHRIYHDMLYPYVLQQIRVFAKTIKQRKINTSIAQYVTLQEITPKVLNDVIDRIEIGHVTRRSKPGSVIQIYWKLQ